jgi:hypothetical protein
VAGRAEPVGERDDSRGQALDVVEQDDIGHATRSSIDFSRKVQHPGPEG